MISRPIKEEYPPYYEGYISLVPEGSLKTNLTYQLENTIALLSDVSETQANYRYELGKWTLKEVIGHITDTERIMSYRLLCISRGDQTPLPGYNHEQYVKEALFNDRSLTELLADLKAVRASTTTLLGGLAEQVWDRTGNASDSVFSVRALAYIISGHELHHVKILKEKYL